MCVIIVLFTDFFYFTKPKQKSYTRHIWKYEQGDYVALKHTANTFDWTSLKHEDINIYTANIAEKNTGNIKIVYTK